MLKEQIRTCLHEIDEELRLTGVKGEICLYGGAVMCLVYDARPSTKDVDAVFRPAGMIRKAARRVAERHDLDEDWLNNGVKGFVVGHPRKVLFDWPNLKVYIAEPEYLLAMKSMAARVDTMDKRDILFLMDKMNIGTSNELFNIIEKYYPRKHIKPATQFFIEELFDK